MATAVRKPLKLTPKQEKELAEALKIQLSPYIPHVPHPTQHAFLWLDSTLEVFFGGAAGGGKALALDTPITTPSGWTTMGDLSPGDLVYGADGQPTRVLACSEVMVDRPCYQVGFDDGTHIIADAEHLWRAEGIRERSAVWAAGVDRKDFTLFSTERIAQTCSVRGRANYSIRPHKPLKGPRLQLPVDPYLLGAWLGDGRSALGSMCLHEEGMFDQVTACGAVIRPSGRFWHVEGLTAGLQQLGVRRNKHIPQEYLRASGEQRLALLQGLMDTDGSCDERGQCALSSSYPPLAQGIYELLRSLGIRTSPPKATPAILDGVRKKDRYRFKFTTSLPAFRLKRKLDRQKCSNFRSTHGRWYITSCELVDSVPVRCIKVAAEDGMFLAGRQMVPTHNSDALLMAALQYVHVPGYNAILFRKTFADLNLPGSLIPRSKEWLSGTDATWNENDSRWTFPSGATISFGYMRNDEDRMRYRSAEFTFIGFDELTTFTELMYTYMFSRLRRGGSSNKKDPLNSVPVRMRAASNPGDRGHTWVKNRFIKPMGRRTNEPKNPQSRIFIKSMLDDNPSIDAEMYMMALENLDDASQQQLIHGDWDAREPGDWVIPEHTWIDAAVALGQELWESPNGVPRDWNRAVSFGIDWGEFTQAYIVWPMPNGGIYIMPSEVIGEHEDAASVTLRILASAERMSIRPDVARYDAAGIQSMRVFAKTSRSRSGWERLRAQKIAFGKYKRETMNYLRLLFKRTAEGKPNRIIAIHPANEVLIRQLRSWKRKTEESEDTDKSDKTNKVDDHGPDAVVAGVAPTAASHRVYINQMIEQAKKQRKEEYES